MRDELGFEVLDPTKSGPLWLDTDFDRAVKAIQTIIPTLLSFKSQKPARQKLALQKVKPFLSAYVAVARRFGRGYTYDPANLPKWQAALISAGADPEWVTLHLSALRKAHDASGEVSDTIWNPAAYKPEGLPWSKFFWIGIAGAAVVAMAYGTPQAVAAFAGGRPKKT